MLVEMTSKAESGVTAKIARAVGHGISDCASMLHRLQEHASLGETKVVVEDGIKVYKCPAGYAWGAHPQRNVGYRNSKKG